MPTGYTSDVQDGKITELKPFVLQCARGMGALIMMRDDPWDAPIPKAFKPSTKYHDDVLRDAQKAITRLAKMSADQCDKAAEEQHQTALKRYDEYKKEKALHRERYDAMIKQVDAWHPPQAILGLKSFMLEQLRDSIKHDCSMEYYDVPKRLTGEEWHEGESAKARRDIEYHSKERANEVRRTDERNLWLEALRASLPA